MLLRNSIIRRYWEEYGGWPGLMTSKYFWAAFCLTLVMFPFWWSQPWYDTSISVLPNLLGFSLAAYAILLSISDSPVKAAMVKSGASLVISATFAHFILVQALALVVALAAKALYPQSGPLADYLKEHVTAGTVVEALGRAHGAFGVFMLVYAVLLTVAAGLGIFRITSWMYPKPVPPSASPPQIVSAAPLGTAPTSAGEAVKVSGGDQANQ